MTNKIGFYCDDNNEVNENIESITVEKPEMKGLENPLLVFVLRRIAEFFLITMINSICIKATLFLLMAS